MIPSWLPTEELFVDWFFKDLACSKLWDGGVRRVFSTCFICVRLGSMQVCEGPDEGRECDRLKKDSWQTISVYVDPSPTFSTLASVLWDIRTRAINHHKQHTWTAVALYPANKRGSTQGAEGTSVPNLNQPCYKTGVWPMLYNDLLPLWATYCDSQSCLCVS